LKIEGKEGGPILVDSEFVDSGQAVAIEPVAGSEVARNAQVTPNRSE
jgi:hypothetical protein